MIEAGESERSDLPRDAQQWLLQAARSQHVYRGKLRPAGNDPPGYERYGESRDGRRVLYLAAKVLIVS